MQLFEKMLDQEEHRIYSWDDSLSVWKERLAKMSWQDAMELWRKYVPRGYKPWMQHDEELWQMFCARLFRIEQPVLKPDFDSWGHILFQVADGSSNAKIKEAVALGLMDEDGPKIVMEACGRLRGFALSPQLVIAGVTATSAFPRTVLRQARIFQYSLLTEEDVVCVETHWEELESMMALTGVPTIRRLNYFQLQPESKSEWNDAYPVWDHRLKKSYCIEHDDYAVLLAKL